MRGYRCPHLKISVTHRPKLSQQSNNYWCRHHKPQMEDDDLSGVPGNSSLATNHLLYSHFPSLSAGTGLLFLFSTTPPSHLSFHRLKKSGEKRHRGCFSVLVPLRVSRCLLTASVALRQWAFPPLELQGGCWRSYLAVFLTK